MGDAQSSETTEMRTAIRRLSLHPYSKYRIPCPRFNEPFELLSFSYDGQRKVRFDDSELKYYFPPIINPPPCLLDGMDTQIRRDHSKNEHIDGLLAALTRRYSYAPNEFQSDFVMYRGMITRIFVTPYSARDSWAMNATKVGSTIYIEDAPKSQAEEQSDFEQKMTYTGYKFETLCLLDRPTHQLRRDGLLDSALLSRSNTVVDTNREYCSVFRTRLGSHSIISSAEVDCIDQEKHGTAPNRLYRELKTSGILDSPRKLEMFERHKLLKFWAQSFIAGIPTVTVGFRDNDGILHNVEDFRTQDIPRLVKHKQGMWQANVCMNFAHQVLHFIKKYVAEEGPEMQYRIAYDSTSQEVQISALGKLEPFLTREFLARVARP